MMRRIFNHRALAIDVRLNIQGLRKELSELLRVLECLPAAFGHTNQVNRIRKRVGEIEGEIERLET